MMHWTAKLTRLGACLDAQEWAQDYPSLEAAWAACSRGDWMLWLAGRVAGPPMSNSRRPLVLASCECARIALPFVQEGEKRPLAAIELAEKWARGDGSISIEGLQASSAAAYASASSAAASASSAAAYASSAAAKQDTLLRCAEIVRKHYPLPPSLREE